MKIRTQQHEQEAHPASKVGSGAPSEGAVSMGTDQDIDLASTPKIHRSKPTPGPWALLEVPYATRPLWELHGPDSHGQAMNRMGTVLDNAADAFLVRAAPDLLAALKGLLDAPVDGGINTPDAIAAAKAAIARAEEFGDADVRNAEMARHVATPWGMMLCPSLYGSDDDLHLAFPASWSRREARERVEAVLAKHADLDHLDSEGLPGGQPWDNKALHADLVVAGFLPIVPVLGPRWDDY